MTDSIEYDKLKPMGLDNLETIKKIAGYTNDSSFIKILNNDGPRSASDNITLVWNIFVYNIYKFFYILKDLLNYEIDILLNSSFSYYDLLLNIIFLILVVIIIMIMYWDSIYRTASDNSRCNIMDTIINENKKITTPYVYKIYIVENTKSIDHYELLLIYDFNRKTTRILYGKNIRNNSDIYHNENITSTSSNPFKYFDLETLNTKSIYNINNEINHPKYVYLIKDSSGNEIKSEYANNLVKFIKDYSTNKDSTTPLHPVYDIIYSIEKEKISKVF